MLRIRFILALFAIATTLLTSVAPSRAQTDLEAEAMPSRFNVPLWTFGGMQFWTDVVHQHGWRIQQHAMSQHYRLVDPRNIRRAWGTLEDCKSELDTLEQDAVAPTTGPTAILLHGLGRSRNSMDPLATHLRESLDCDVINISYASTRASLDHHARALQSVIEHLPAEKPIVVVAHSLGNLVLRRYLHLVETEHEGSQTSARIERIVMLGPPNQGAELAAKLDQMELFGIVMGDSALQMADLSDSELPLKLATPDAEFGIIAGQWNLGPVNNPLLERQNDLFVAVDETRLAGAADFAIVEVAHGWLLSSADVAEMTSRFLEHGYFYSADRREPITESEKDPNRP